MSYFKDGAFRDDPWAGRIILSVPDWQDRKGGSLPRPLGVKLDPGFAVETIGGDLSGVSLIKIDFPKFTDGRGYSMGWLLRSRFAYRCEMRATGDVLFDEMQFMVRCGFDAFEVFDAETIRLLKDGRRGAFDRFYQPGLETEVPAGTRPWARRSAPDPRGNPA